MMVVVTMMLAARCKKIINITMTKAMMTTLADGDDGVITVSNSIANLKTIQCFVS